MELSVKDRLYLPTFLPARGNFKEFNLKKEILRKIAIGDEERKTINLRENAEDKRIEWDVEKEHPLEVEFSADEMAYLQAACEKISDEELPTTCGAPWRRFITKSPKTHKPKFLSAATLSWVRPGFLYQHHGQRGYHNGCRIRGSGNVRTGCRKDFP